MSNLQFGIVGSLGIAIAAVGCAVGGGESVGSTTGPLTAQNTLTDVKTRFLRRLEQAPQRLDKDLIHPRIEHRAVAQENGSNPVTSKAGAFLGVDQKFASMPALADGALVLQNAGARVDVHLDGAAAVVGETLSGYVVYPAASVGGGAILLRPTQGSVEDYVVYESAPSAPEATYSVELASGIAGLRLVDDVLEFLDSDGTPRLRASAPYLVDSTEATIRAKVSVSGCAVDTSGAAPWGRPTTPPGADVCTLHVSWLGANVSYPAILDPVWSNTGTMVQPRTKHTSRP